MKVIQGINNKDFWILTVVVSYNVLSSHAII